MAQPRKNVGQRIVYAPVGCGPDASSGVISVVLGDDEDVSWCWTHFPDGRSVVTGYEIIKKDQDAGEEGFSFEKAVSDLLWPEKGRKAPPPVDACAPDEGLKRTRRRAGF